MGAQGATGSHGGRDRALAARRRGTQQYSVSDRYVLSRFFALSSPAVLRNDPRLDQAGDFLWRKPQQAAKHGIVVGAEWSGETLDVARGGM